MHFPEVFARLSVYLPTLKSLPKGYKEGPLEGTLVSFFLYITPIYA